MTNKGTVSDPIELNSEGEKVFDFAKEPDVVFSPTTSGSFVICLFIYLSVTSNWVVTLNLIFLLLLSIVVQDGLLVHFLLVEVACFCYRRKKW